MDAQAPWRHPGGNLMALNPKLSWDLCSGLRLTQADPKRNPGRSQQLKISYNPAKIQTHSSKISNKPSLSDIHMVCFFPRNLLSQFFFFPQPWLVYNTLSVMSWWAKNLAGPTHHSVACSSPFIQIPVHTVHFMGRFMLPKGCL